MQRLARAKVNLTLRVTGRRPAGAPQAGYHTLDSLVVFAELGDRLRFAPAPSLRLALSGRFAPALAGGEGENLVLRAARHLAAAGGRAPQAAIHLEKNLPVASGIGGGSADAAAALLGLAELWRLDRKACDLPSLAAALGADVPVCLAGEPCRLTGIGEELRPLPPLPPAWLVLANPLMPVSTPAVFARREGPFSPPLEPPATFADAAALAAFARAGGNDLLAPARQLCPAIDSLLQALGALPGVLHAGLSGSGATCYALFAEETTARAAEARLAAAEPGWWIAAAPLSRGLQPAAWEAKNGASEHPTGGA